MTVSSVKQGIYKWGIYPALIVLRKEQDNENYELCSLLKQAIDEVSDDLEWFVSSNVDDLNIDRVYNNILLTSSNPELMINNMPMYVDGFRLLINYSIMEIPK